MFDEEIGGGGRFDGGSRLWWWQRNVGRKLGSVKKGGGGPFHRGQKSNASRGSRRGRTIGEKDREREPGETKVGQWPGHVEKNGAQRAGRRHTVLLIHRPHLAAPGSVCPFRKRFAITIVKMRCEPTRRLFIATLPVEEKETFSMEKPVENRSMSAMTAYSQLIISRQGCAGHQPL